MRPEEFYATQELVDQLLQPGVRREATKHTTSTNLVRQGVDVKTLQKFLGHADMRSTDRYVVLGSGDVKDTIRGQSRSDEPPQGLSEPEQHPHLGFD